MIKKFTVRIIALILIVSTMIPVGILSVFANNESDAELSVSEQNTHTKNDLYGKFFMIYSESCLMPMIFSKIDRELDVFFAEADENDSGAVFRFIPASDGKYYINSAFSNADYYLTVTKEENDDGSEVSYKTDITTKENALPFFIEDHDTYISFAVDIDGKRMYLSLSGNSFVLTEEKVYGEWSLIDVIPTELSLAYFETRVKLYSVENFHVKVSPESLRSFLDWESDNEGCLLVSADGTICALTEGEATLRARLGNIEHTLRIEVVDSDTYTWYSQYNIENSYWNGGALSEIKFRGKYFAKSNANQWMNEGCAIASCAMALKNMGATYEKGYDFRSGQLGNLPADPYTVALANAGHLGFKSNKANYGANPIYVAWSTVTKAFKLNGHSLEYQRIYSSNLKKIKNALESHPEGIVVAMEKPNGDTHYVLFAECINPEETVASRLKFKIFDSLSFDGSDGDNVLFEDSASYKAGYRFGHIKSFIYWEVTK